MAEQQNLTKNIMGDDVTAAAGPAPVANTPVKTKGDADAISSPPFSPSTPPPPPSSPPPVHHGGDDKSNLPIVKLLEVENELRKRESSNCLDDLENVAENDSAKSEDDENMLPEQPRIISKDAVTSSPMRVDGPREKCAIEVSDSEDDKEGGGTNDNDEEEEEEEEWEDFMVQYWQSTSDVTPLQADRLREAEDTDLQPCPMEPELDVEPKENALSAMQTGNMDIDTQEFDRLSSVGLESTRAMAQLTVGNGGSKGPKGSKSIEGLRIHVGHVEVRAPIPPPSDRIEEQPAVRSVPIPSSVASSSFDALDMKSTRSSAAGSDAGAAGTGNSNDWKHSVSPLPSVELVLMTGPILTRTSLRSLVMKKWHESFWMRYGEHKLMIFRSKEHMDDWLYNPYHGQKQRDFLVKLEIDFLKDMDDGEGGNSASHAKKDRVLGHRILPVKKKSYGKNEDEMYQFKLERWTNVGCSVLAAFASREEAEVQILHDKVAEMLRACPENGLRNIDHMLK